MTTLDCLVGKNRNSEAALPLVRKAICDALGLQDLLVLPEGLYGDHTDGHIDNVARFVSPPAWSSPAKRIPSRPTINVSPKTEHSLKRG
jgi:agmatine/peptidylarginine deiminase